MGKRRGRAAGSNAYGQTNDPDEKENGSSSGQCTHTNKVKVRKVKEAISDLIQGYNKSKGKATGKFPAWLCFGCGFVEYRPTNKPLAHFTPAKCGGLAGNLTSSKLLIHCFKCNRDLDEKSAKTNPRYEEILAAMQKLLDKGIVGEGAVSDTAKVMESTVDAENAGDGGGEGKERNETEIKGRTEEKHQETQLVTPEAKKVKLPSKVDVPKRAFGPREFKHFPPKGLHNLGNTCFFNSVIQNLLTNEMLRETLGRGQRSDGSAPLFQNLKHFFGEMTSKSSGKSSVSPASVFSSVCRNHTRFRGGRQHDSHELLRAMLDSLKDEKAKCQPISEKGKEVVEIVKDWDEKQVLSWFTSIGLGPFEAKPAIPLDGAFMKRLVTNPKEKKVIRVLKKLITEKDDKRRFSRAVSEMRKGRIPGKEGEVVGNIEKEAKKGEGKAKEKPKSFVESIFGGSLLNCVQCLRCKRLSLTNESFMDLSLAITAPQSYGKGRYNKSNYSGGRKLTKAQRKALAKAKLRQEKERKRKKQRAKAVGVSSVEDDEDEDDLEEFTRSLSKLTKKQKKKAWLERKKQLKQAKQAEQAKKAEQTKNAEQAEQAKQAKKSPIEDAEENGEKEEGKALNSGESNQIEDGKETVSMGAKKEESHAKQTQEGRDQARGNDQARGEGDTGKEGELKSGPNEVKAGTENRVEWHVVFPDGLNVRECPDSSATVVGSLDFKAKVIALETRGDWIRHNKGWTVTHDAIGTVFLSQDPEQHKDIHEDKTDEKDDSEDSENENEEVEIYKPGEVDMSAFYRDTFFPDGGDKSMMNYDTASKKLLSGSSASLHDCLSVFTAPEDLSGGNYICVHCSKEKGDIVRTDARKRVLIHHCPETLTIHLKRFAATATGFQKVGKSVNIPVMLDLSPFCIPETPASFQKCDSRIYTLTGIVVHSGGMGGGHYVAYTRRGPEKWYYFSDRSFREVREQNVLNAQAYMCFFKRLDSHGIKDCEDGNTA